MWLNRAVTLAETGEALAAWRVLPTLTQDPADYQPFQAAAEVLAGLGRAAGSRAAHDRAIATAGSSADARFLTTGRAQLPE